MIPPAPNDPSPSWSNSLTRAFAVYDAYAERVAAGTAEPWEQFLAAHAELAELLSGLRDGHGPATEPDPARDAPTVEPLPLGEIDRFQLLRLLGRGGYGVVYLARDSRGGREVALKLLNLAFADDVRRKRFELEARALATLGHPGICPVHDFDLSGPQPWIAMQFVAGATLRDVLDAQGPRPTPERIGERVHLLEQVARALQHAHERGLLHRDVKPSNVMVTSDGHPVLLDFGLVRQTVDADQLTLSGMALGSPPYMAPERHAAADDDARADVWSLGVVLYECVTGQRPFDVQPGETWSEVVKAGSGRPLRRARGLLPGALVDVVDKALQPDPRHRYASAAEFAEDLRRWRAREPVRARRNGALLQVLRWSQRQPLAAALIAGLAGASLAIGGLAWRLAATAASEARARGEAGHALALANEREASLAFDSASREASYGRWTLAEAGYQRAAALGHDPVAIELGRIELWDARGDRERSQRALEALVARDDLRHHGALVALLPHDPSRALDGDVPDVWRARLGELLASGELRGGWPDYTRALLAETLPAALECLDAALAKDVRHRAANEMRWPIVLLVQGRQAALACAERFGVLYPEDPLAALLRAASLRLLRRDDEAASLAATHAIAPEALAMAGAFVKFCSVVREGWQTQIDVGMQNYFGVAPDVRTALFDVAGRITEVAKGLTDVDEPQLALRFPPSAHQALTASLAGVGLAMLGAPKALDLTLRNLPLAPFFVIRGNQRLLAGDVDGAWADLQRASTGDLFELDVSIAIFRVGVGMARQAALAARSAEEGVRARADVVAAIDTVLRSGWDLRPLDPRYLASRALDLGEALLAQECLARLQRAAVDDPDASVHCASLMLRADLTESARNLATAVLARWPDHAAAQRLLAQLTGRGIPVDADAPRSGK